MAPAIRVELRRAFSLFLRVTPMKLAAKGSVSLLERQMPQRVELRVKEIRNHPVEIVAGDHHQNKQDGTHHQVLHRLGRRKKEAFFWFSAQLVLPPPVKEKPQHANACRPAEKDRHQ